MRKALLCTSAMIWLVVQSTSAQVVSGDSFRPTFGEAELQRMLIDLDACQEVEAPVIRALHADMVDHLRRKAESVRSDLERVAVRERQFKADNPSIEDPWVRLGEDFGRFAVWQHWFQVRAEIERQFVEDVARILDPPSSVRWIDIVRRHRRERALPSVASSSPSRPIPDLRSVANHLKMLASEKAFVDDILTEFEGRLDDLLCRWEVEHDGLAPRLHAAAVRFARTGDQDAQRDFLRLQERLDVLADETRTLVHLTAQDIAASLGADNSSRFRDLALEVEFPRLFRPSPVDLVASYLLEAASLDEGRREAIEEIYESYRRERDVVRQAAIRAIRAWETRAAISARSDRKQRILAEGGDPVVILQDHRVIAELERLHDLAMRACVRIKEVLGAAALERMPAEVRVLLAW